MTPSPPDRYAVPRQFYESLMKSQWLPESRILAYQERQLQQMLAHAHAEVPFYEEPLGRIRRPDGSFDLTRWNELPIIDRDVVSANYDAFVARSLPPGHTQVLDLSTSGSESKHGFRVRKTRFEHTGTACASFRYASWFDYDYGTPLAMIRAGFIGLEDKGDPEDRRWGPPWVAASERSARYRLHIATPVDEQLDWLSGLGRVILNTLPSNAMALAQRSEERGLNLRIAGVMTVGELLTADMRGEVMRIWGCRISDVYSTAETGLIAIECPDTGVYHLQSEISRSEILGANDQPCVPGQLGRIVSTSIYNFAMPLIRYRFNDLVEPGPACTCGRGLPVMRKIWGREKNLFKRTDGSYFLPNISTRRLREIADIREWQLVQDSSGGFTLRVPQELESTTARRKVMRYVSSLLPEPATVSIVSIAATAKTSGGKKYCYVRE